MSTEVEVVSNLPAMRERTSVLLMPVMDVNTAMKRLEEFQTFCANYLQESKDGGNDGGDYGIIPGAGKKKVLLKSGADKLCEVYGLADAYQIKETIDWDRGLFDYEITCLLTSRRDDSLVGTGVGSCSSYESKYRWRDSRRKCPKCGVESIIKGKDEYGGGWVCFDKKGGCKAKFKDGDTSIEGQTIGRIQNDDIADVKNSVLKMAKKRAKIDAVIGVTRSSGIFTQDMEDFPMPPAKPTVPVTTEETPLPKPKSAASNPAQGGKGTPSGPKEMSPEAAEEKLPEVPADCIGEGQAKNFHISFRNALRPALRKNAEELAHDYLRQKDIKDVMGKPSAYGIKQASFYDVRDDAEQHARSL